MDLNKDRTCVQKNALLSLETRALCNLLLLKILQWNKIWKQKTAILMILTLCRLRLMWVYILVFNKKVYKIK
jgi:hypothetical protein